MNHLPWTDKAVTVIWGKGKTLGGVRAVEGSVTLLQAPFTSWPIRYFRDDKGARSWEVKNIDPKTRKPGPWERLPDPSRSNLRKW